MERVNKLAFEHIKMVSKTKAEECLQRFLEVYKQKNEGVADITPFEKLMVLEAYEFGFMEGCDYYGKAMLEHGGVHGTPHA